MNRVEDRRFLTGQAAYVDDIDRPGTLHVAFTRSTTAHGLLQGVETAETRAVDGVVDVIAGADIADACEPTRGDSRHESWQRSEQWPLAPERVLGYIEDARASAG
jgi:carbon-monoxide dehydrogenase large subunit